MLRCAGRRRRLLPLSIVSQQSVLVFPVKSLVELGLLPGFLKLVLQTAHLFLVGFHQVGVILVCHPRSGLLRFCEQGELLKVFPFLDVQASLVLHGLDVDDVVLVVDDPVVFFQLVGQTLHFAITLPPLRPQIDNPLQVFVKDVTRLA